MQLISSLSPKIQRFGILSLFFIIVSPFQSVSAQYEGYDAKTPEFYFDHGRKEIDNITQQMLLSLVSDGKTRTEKAFLSEAFTKKLQFVRVKEPKKDAVQGFLIAECSTGVFVYSKTKHTITYIDYSHIDFIRRGRSWTYKVNVFSLPVAGIGALAGAADDGISGFFTFASGAYFTTFFIVAPIVTIVHLTQGAHEWDKFHFNQEPKNYKEYKEILLEDVSLYTNRIYWENIPSGLKELDAPADDVIELNGSSVDSARLTEPTPISKTQPTSPATTPKPSAVNTIGTFKGKGDNVNLQWILTDYTKNVVDAERLIKKFGGIRSQALTADLLNSSLSNASEAKFLAMIIATGAGVSFNNVEALNDVQKNKLKMYESAYPTDADIHGVIDNQTLSESDVANLQLLFDYVSVHK